MGRFFEHLKKRLICIHILTNLDTGIDPSTQGPSGIPGR